MRMSKDVVVGLIVAVGVFWFAQITKTGGDY